MTRPTALLLSIVRIVIATALLVNFPVAAQNEVKGTPTKVDPGKELDQIIEHPTPERAKSFDEVVDRAVNSERMLIRRLRDKTPVIETYIQEMKPDAELGLVPHNDFYFLGQLNMKDGLVDMSYLPPRTKVKAVSHFMAALFTMQYNSRGFADELFIDVADFDRAHYSFEYVRREFLGEVRCYRVDVSPREEAGRRRFKGTIWIEDRDYNIVRVKGQYQPSNEHEYVHFDCWRVNSGGMCCTSRIGRGNSDGNCGKIAPRAVGPPVETPMTTTLGRIFVLCRASLLSLSGGAP